MTGRRASQPGQARRQPNGRASPKPASVDFPVVALGASAGGLDAFKKFFDALPANSGMAFVLIQHLDPTHESLMVDLLTGHTPMKVLQAANGMRLERDRVYLIPPGAYLAIAGSTLRVSKPLERHGARMPFDFFLRSLAEECGERAICAILSGTGTDGSLGLKAVKEKGGLVIVQDPEEAAFDGMPRSAILSGGADLVLTVAKIPQALVRYGRQTYVKTGPTDVRSSDTVQEAFTGIIDLLAAKTPHDFSLYKLGTLQRRIERRMAMAGIESGAGYLQVLREDSGERELLAKDLLINVTHFFRDTAAFDLLGEKIIPELVQRQTLDRPLRIWVPGCSTGEEAYSISMLFLEQIAAAKRNIKLQVFASDIDADCVAFARNGIYPESIEADVTPTRLARFFTKEDHSYQVVRELREAVVFTSQSLLADAPFSRLDLISCRNLLIYLGPEAQRKILSLFHFALHKDGVLFLGSSETVGSASDHFEPVSRNHRIYRRIGRSRPGEVEFPRGTNAAGRFHATSLAQRTRPRGLGYGELSQRALLEVYAPASVLINAKHEGLYYLGSMDRYLKVVSGEGTQDVLAMAREGLRAKLRSAIQRAKQDHARVTVTGGQLKRNERAVGVSITVLPVEGDNEELFLVSFVDDPTPDLSPARPVKSAADASRVAQVELELAATREDLQSAIRDLEMANEEHKAINEEAMSVNEEYQSTNEELETSKEELQSLNEELTALNSQLHETVEQQRAASNDLQNILNSTDMATLFLDADLRIRFFTPAAKSLFNVIASDVGRPLADLTRRFEDCDLLRDARAVLASHVPIRREVKADDDGWFMRGMLPYRSEDGEVEGLVITFSSISEIKAAEREIEVARAYLDSIIATIRQPLVVLDEELRVISASTDSLREIAGHGCVHLNKPVRAKELTRFAQRLIAKPRPAASDSVQQLPLFLDGDEPSTVFVVDDDRAIREAMRDLLNENGYAVEVFADGPAFLEAYRPGREGCLLVDVLMPGMSGIELIERLQTEGHRLPAIMITGSGAVPMAVQAMKAGAVDFVEKPVSHEDLLASVKRALEHTRDTAALSARRETAALSVASLTTRQRQILDLVLAGHPSKNIAADLGISQRTVDNHRAAIMRKTGSKSLPALVRTALAAA